MKRIDRTSPAVLGLAALLLGGCGNTPGTAAGKAGSGWTPLWADAASAQLRPGSRISLGSSGCTAGFLFVDPVTATYYMGTAAHCSSSEDPLNDGVGIRVELAGYGEIGTVVFDSDSTNLILEYGLDDRVDFSLVQLDEGINLIAHPQVISLDAPTGIIDCAATATGDRFSFHGHGLVFGQLEQTRTRDGVLAVCDGDEYAGYTAAIFGDSGGPVAHASGAALGLISGAGLHTTPPTELFGPTLPFILRELAKAGRGSVALATLDGGYVGLP